MEKYTTQFNSFFWIEDKPSQYSDIYLQKSKKYLRFISFLPWLEFVWVGNSIWLWYANKNSDIDLFVVTSPNMLWFVRFFMTLYFQILWLRKNKNKHAWRFCLSFFMTSRSLNFWPFLIENDIYMYFWIKNLKVIIDNSNISERIISENKDNFKLQDIKLNRDYILPRNKLSRLKFNTFNNIIKKVFYKRTYNKYLELWKPFWITITEDILKFHNNDKRKTIRNNIEMI